MSGDDRGARSSPMVGSRPRGEFLNRLWYYLVGVAIGFVLVGMLLAARTKHQRQQPQTQQQAPHPQQQATP